MYSSKLIKSALFLCLCLIACSDKKQIEILDFETEEYPIFIGTDGINTFYNFSHDFFKSDSIFHFHDYMLDRIITVDFHKQKIIKHTEILDEKYPLRNVWEFHSEPNGFIVRHQNYIYKINNNGEVYERINVIDFDNIPFFMDREPNIKSQVSGGGDSCQ